MKGLCSVLFLGCAAFLGLYLIEHRANQNTEFALEMSSQTNQVLRDQLQDYERFALNRSSAVESNKVMWEQGYNAAIIRSGGTGTYADGFADAERKYKNGGYTEGYHACLAQFGDMLTTKQREGSTPANAE